jgi:hypothetical protein
MIAMTDPRRNPECDECVTGQYECEGQTTTPRGEMRSLYECSDCGDEVLFE